jgi:hypothetical protein
VTKITGGQFRRRGWDYTAGRQMGEEQEKEGVGRYMKVEIDQAVY